MKLYRLQNPVFVGTDADYTKYVAQTSYPLDQPTWRASCLQSVERNFTKTKYKTYKYASWYKYECQRVFLCTLDIGEAEVEWQPL